MKNLLRLCLTCILLVTMTTASVFAATSVTSAVKAVPAGEAMHYEVTIRGTATARTAVSLEVLDSSGKSVMIEQLRVDPNGNFSLPIIMTSAGDYTVYMNDYLENLPKTSRFSLLPLTYYEGVALRLNEASDTETMIHILADESTKLGLDLRYYTEAVYDTVASEMLKHKGNFTAFNISELFDESVVKAYLCHEKNHSEAENIIAYYDSYLKIKSQSSPKSMFHDFLKLADNVKKEILLNAFLSLENLNDACEHFHLATAQNVIKMLSNTEMDKFITAHIDYYEFEGYEELQNETFKKSKVLNALREAELGDTKVSLQEAYKTVVDEIENPGNIEDDGNGNENSGSGFGGGSGGGGGGISFSGGAVSATTKVYETESLPTPQEATEDITMNFTDLNAVPWANEAIVALAQKGIVNGKEQGIFAPNDSITRQEYAKILALTFSYYDEAAEASFNDIEVNHWAYRYVASNQKEGYITGYPDGGFHGDEAISRQDMAVILYRILSHTKAIPLQDKVTNPFKDYSEISEYAQNAVLMLYNAKIIFGVNDDTFESHREATRAEICVMLNRVLNQISE